jgi:hypothetical protein
METFRTCNNNATINININNDNDNKDAYAGQLNSVIQLRALLVLTDRGIWAHSNRRRWWAD